MSTPIFSTKQDIDITVDTLKSVIDKLEKNKVYNEIKICMSLRRTIMTLEEIKKNAE